MDKAQPDNHVLEAIYTAFNDTVVDTHTIKVFDTVVPNDNGQADPPDHYVLVSTMSSEVQKSNMCEWHWSTDVLCDVVTKFPAWGNQGNRQLANNILEALKDATNNLTLDVSSGLTVETQTASFPSDLANIGEEQHVFRKFLRLNLVIR